MDEGSRLISMDMSVEYDGSHQITSYLVYLDLHINTYQYFLPSTSKKKKSIFWILLRKIWIFFFLLNELNPIDFRVISIRVLHRINMLNPYLVCWQHVQNPMFIYKFISKMESHPPTWRTDENWKILEIILSGTYAIMIIGFGVLECLTIRSWKLICGSLV